MKWILFFALWIVPSCAALDQIAFDEHLDQKLEDLGRKADEIAGRIDDLKKEDGQVQSGEGEWESLGIGGLITLLGGGLLSLYRMIRGERARTEAENQVIHQRIDRRARVS